MRSRLVVALAVLMAVGALIFVVSRFPATQGRPPAAHSALRPVLASYLGVFEDGAPPGYQPVIEFTNAAGRRPNLLGCYSGWGQPFDAPFAGLMHRHGITLFVQIDPRYASLPDIIAGQYDDYLRSYADSVRAFGHSVVIGFGHEMNASWYPWGYGHVPAATFVLAWRHIVTLFRGQGADNVTWLWTINADEPGTGSIQTWWPGRQYVTWVGIDGYYVKPTDTFDSVFGRTIDQVRTFANKPILLSETAVGPAAGQFIKIQNLFRGMARYSTLGLVWFDKNQISAKIHQDWRIEDSRLADDAFQLSVRDEMVAVDR